MDPRKDLDCTYSTTALEPGIVIYCHYLPVVDWVICATAAFLDVVAAFRPSRINPTPPPPANTMVASFERPRTLQHADAKSASTGPGHRPVEQKLGIRLAFIIQPSPSTAAIHMGP
ncbi:hypothetical protein H6P81_021731 [Aristolochia fimbriata]|uniref:Uncharacterized protein n=1 Tax=Aristolochia fimbriata TaxID=158543 RepID=A0AAV7DQU4_ARIFI|nr:hypothetical protein H6P81_021731 [Aristolochia fimbriata]